MHPSLSIHRRLILASFFLIPVGGASSEAADGTSKPIPPPARRWEAAATYDPVGDQLIVFGGAMGNGYPGNDTWGHALASGVWAPKLQASPFPPARRDGTLSHDSLRGRLILFGGSHTDPVLSTTLYLNDVWVASPSDAGWTQLAVSGTPPPPRAGHVALYDAAGDRLIVCGGTNDVTPELDDVWELTFSGTPTWNEITPNQSLAIKEAAAVIDADDSRLVLFGGSVGSTRVNQTWALSLSHPIKWTQLSPAGAPPPDREGHSAVFDPAMGRMIVFGGVTAGFTRSDEVWALSLTGAPQWTQLAPTGTLPQGRASHNAIWDTPRGRMVVFGGHLQGTPSRGNDLWALDPSAGWSEIPAMPNPGRRSRPSSFFDPVRERLIVFGGTDGVVFSNAVWTHALAPGAPWIPLTTNGTPPSPRAGASFVYDPSRDRAVLFGGIDDAATYKNDVWLLDLSSNTWSPESPTGTAPPTLSTYTAVYDPPRDRMVVHEGQSTWELVFSNPPAWTQLAPSGAPPGIRVRQTAVLDPVRERMVFFGGGSGGSLYYTDVWTLSLSGSPAWTQLTPSGTPPQGRVGHSAFYDPQGDRMLIFAGGQAVGPFTGPFFNDNWELRFSGTPTWNELHLTGVLPPDRVFHGWGYDSIHGTLLVFGGFHSLYGATDDSWVLHYGAGTTGVEPPTPPVPLRLTASPNPVLTRTNLRFHLKDSQLVTLSVHDVQGRRVAVLVDRVLEAGDHEIAWEPMSQSLSSGVYFYDLVAGRARASGRLVLLR